MTNNQIIQHQKQIVAATSPLIRASVRKLQLVARAVKKMAPREAIAALTMMPKAAAEPIRKTIVQAVANAANNFKINEKNLNAMNIEVQEGVTMKRFRIGGRGRVKPVLKRTSRVTVKLFTENGKQ